MTGSPAAPVRWLHYDEDGHVYEPHRTLPGQEHRWIALCGGDAEVENGQCGTCMERLVDVCAER